MASVYLSPSTAEQQLAVTGQNEEYYMNLIVDAMIPYLRASGIDFDRNNPDMTVAQIVDQSNTKYHDLHLQLDMDSAVGNLAGLLRGLDIVYYTGSPGGQEAAQVFFKNMRLLYPDPNLITVSSDRLNRQLRDTDAAALQVILGYRDNPIDATWLENNINSIARNLSMSLAEYLGVSFVDVPITSSINHFISYLTR